MRRYQTHLEVAASVAPPLSDYPQGYLETQCSKNIIFCREVEFKSKSVGLEVQGFPNAREAPMRDSFP